MSAVEDKAREALRSLMKIRDRGDDPSPDDSVVTALDEIRSAVMVLHDHMDVFINPGDKYSRDGLAFAISSPLDKIDGLQAARAASGLSPDALTFGRQPGADLIHRWIVTDLLDWIGSEIVGGVEGFIGDHEGSGSTTGYDL